MNFTNHRLRILLVAASVLGASAVAHATSAYLSAFVTAYPATKPSPLNACVLCHINPAGGGTRNPYGNDFANASVGNHTFNATLAARDSDGDGYSNITEINALTFPGDPTSHPGAADTTPPTVTGFAIPSTSASLTVPINLLSATDNLGVTGYLLTESSTKPAATASGWAASPPSSYTFSSAGAKTLYAWAKDAAGNVSNSMSASVTITLPAGPDTTRPTVTAFSLPASSSSLTVAIVSFTATDNVGVTGYLLTTTSATPSSGAAGWTSAAPATYTFASAGTGTLYAWAKDAAGNVSTSRSASTSITLPVTSSLQSINSTSQNRSSAPGALVSEQAATNLANYQILAANDLGMHCGDLDQRVASILPPFNVLHAQVVKKGHVPVILDNTQLEVVYSAAFNPQDPALANPAPGRIYKTDFWDKDSKGHPIAFDAFDPYYPPGILGLFQLSADAGLPVPNLQLLYPMSGMGTLVADQQAMPSANSSFVTQPYSANVPQPFALFYKFLPFFKNFAFGYNLSPINWFSAEGIPLTPFDDIGRQNSYPLMRVQARAIQGNTLGLSAGAVMSSLDVVAPVSGEVSCGNCHLSAPYGNGAATSGITAATPLNDPRYGQVPAAVSLEYAFDLNILRLHDLRNGTNLQSQTPVSCQRCHYTPALDLAHVGPADTTNGRQQTTHESFSRAMHYFHGSLGVFPNMPSPVGRSTATRDAILAQTCYQCHPGQNTKCFRGEMFNAGQACQDCHGNMTQVGSDFSQNVLAGKGFMVSGTFYTNSTSPRVPWANEPMCQSCHTGDINSNLTASTGVVKGADGLRLIQAYKTGDANAKPIVATNRRFAENQTGSGTTTKQVLYRLSRGHGGIFCEGCHGSTHAEWPNATASANDNVAATQLQGHSGKIVECATCHGSNTLTTTDFVGNFDSNGLMKGPHGMHPVDRGWISGHHSVYTDSRTPAGTCQSCHGSQLQGSVLSRAAATRTFNVDDGRTVTITQGTQVSCSLCHGNPASGRIDD